MSEPVPHPPSPAHRRRSAWSRTAGAAITVVVVLTLAACSGAVQRFDDAIGQGVAAVETARLAVEQQLDDRVFPTVTSTALRDARRELIDAATSVSETDAAGADEATRRTEVLDALHDGVDAVNDARDAMAGIGSLEASVAQLDEAAAHLEGLAQRRPPAAGSGR